MLVLAVVVGSDGTAPDVHLGTDDRVAEIRQVLGLRSRPDDALLDLDEVADLGPVTKLGLNSKMGKRPNRTAATDLDAGNR